MNQRLHLSCICLLLFVSLAAVPVLAATTVTCPSSCSCLLPAEAQKMGYTNYCQGQQKVCAYESQKNEKYCYEKPVKTTAPHLIVTGFKVVTTTPTTVAPQKCAAGCTCLSSADGKGKGLLYCSGKQTVCGYSGTTPLYCFSLPAATQAVATTTRAVTTAAVTHGTTVPCGSGCSCLDADKAKEAGLERCSGSTAACSYDPSGRPIYCYAPGRVTMVSPVPAGSTAPPVQAVAGTNAIPVPGPCPSGCSCLDEMTIRKNGYPFCGGNRTECGFSKTAGVLYCAETGAAPGGGAPAASGTAVQGTDFFSSITSFFVTLFYSPASSAPPGDSIMPSGNLPAATSYCHQRFGLDYCSGQCVDFSTDPDNCGGCGLWCRQDSFVNEQCCSGTRADIWSDPDNCGGCGNVCPEGAPCIDGYCSALGCMSPSLTDCNRSCVSTRDSEANCGSCGSACLAGEACYSGTCRPCTGEDEFYCPGTGCTDIQTDDQNCGRCQHTCSGRDVCIAGECSGCPEGTTKCGSRCVDLMTDRAACGECGHSCGYGQTCTSGRCTCDDGSTVCGRDCVDVQTSRFNCGRCGFECPPGTTCVGGYCRCPGYEEGWEYCWGTGCVDTMSDRDNCGHCGGICSGFSPYCVNGRCCLSEYDEC